MQKSDDSYTQVTVMSAIGHPRLSVFQSQKVKSTPQADSWDR